MSRFLRKLREFIIGTEEGEEFPPTLPLGDEVQGKFAYKGTMYLYEGAIGGHPPYNYIVSRKIETEDKLLGKASITFLLDEEVKGNSGLVKVAQQPTAPGNWLQALKSGVEKREALIKRVGREYE